MEGLGDLADPLDAADELVARAQETGWVAARPDAGWSAREEQVPGEEWRDRRYVCDQLGDRKDHLGARLRLHRFTVQLAIESYVARTEFVGRDDPGAERAEAGERLAEAELRRGTAALYISCREVLADRDTGHVRPGVRFGDLGATLADDRDELDLPVDHRRGQRNISARTGQAGLELGEDERRLRRREVGLGRVLGVVERDREHLARLRHRRSELRRVELGVALERAPLRP